MTFDTSGSTYQGSGIGAVQGIGFSIIDSDGVVLAAIDYVNQIPSPSTNPVYVLDLSSVNFVFLFQTFSIQGAIKDQNGTQYFTTTVYKTVCQPVNFLESGYVPGIFQVSADCVNNSLTVKELTLLTYNNSTPSSVSKSGTLYYPLGTISQIDFSGTPFSNNVVYTGQYKIYCETTATYDLGDGVCVDITYITNSVFDVVCSDKMSDLLCCVKQVQDTANRNCDNAVGQHAKQQLNDISSYLLTGLLKEINGQDSSSEAAFIKKQLNCNCGATSIGQNEVTLVNPSVYNIVILGGGDVTTDAITVGSTKTYTITSKVYQVVKGDTGDLAFTITQDTSVSNTVKYKITFNYTVMSGYILTAIQNDPTLLSQLNALIESTGITGLDGKCVIDLSAANYFFTQSGLSSSTSIENIVINGTIYTAPTLFANNPVGIQSWLNSLSLGTWSVSYSTGTLSVSTNSNTNVVATMTVGTPDLTIQFQSTNKSLVEILQAIIDYICGITALQVALGNSLSLCQFDYNGNVTTLNYGPDQTQGAFNSGVASVICNLASRIDTISTITCAKIKSIFLDSPSSNFTGNARVYGNDGTNCIGFDNVQVAKGVLTAINDDSTTKTQFCAISCPEDQYNLTNTGTGNIAVVTGSFPTQNVFVPNLNKILKTGYIHIGDMNTAPADPNCSLLASSTNGLSAYVYTFPSALADANYLPIAILGNNANNTWALFNANFDCTLEVGLFTATQFYFAISTTSSSAVQDLAIKFICVSTV
jgi:hypothetical protein